MPSNNIKNNKILDKEGYQTIMMPKKIQKMLKKDIYNSLSKKLNLNKNINEKKN